MGNVSTEPLAEWEHCTTAVLHTSFRSYQTVVGSPVLPTVLAVPATAVMHHHHDEPSCLSKVDTPLPQLSRGTAHSPLTMNSIHLRSLPELYSTQAFSAANLYGPKSKKGIPGPWNVPVIPALGRQRQEDKDFKAILGYRRPNQTQDTLKNEWIKWKIM